MRSTVQEIEMPRTAKDSPQIQYAEVGYLILRLGVAFLFIFHAPQKYYGWWSSPAFPLLSLRGAAIIMEIIVSPLIALGLFTRVAAVIGAVEMVGAYWVVHRLLGRLPIENRGELACMYLLVFVYMAFRGGGTYSLDNKLHATR
jgi:putative oxidoreductase